MDSRGVVGSTSGYVSRGCSGAGGVVPRRENTNRTAFPSVPKKRKESLSLPLNDLSNVPAPESLPKLQSRASDLSFLIAPGPDPASENSALCGSAPSLPHLLPSHPPLPQWSPGSPAVPGNVGFGAPGLSQAC